MVVNDSSRATSAKVSIRAMRRGTKAPVIGATTVNVGAHSSAAYTVAVKLPSGLAKGNYYLSACTPNGKGAGALGCATAEQDAAGQGRHPRSRHAGSGLHAGPHRAGSGLHLGRALAAAGGLQAVSGDGQHRLHERPHRRQPRL